METKKTIHIGEKHGKVTVTRILDNIKYYKFVEGVCDCGVVKQYRYDSLLSGNTKSCGCLFKESKNKRNITHGMRKFSEYNIWNHIKHRCNNKNVWNYFRYGGRGIKMCDQWVNSFEQFYKDVGPRPAPGYSIERKNNDGNYEPGNCVWASVTEQCNNRSSNVRVEYDGKNLTIAQWSIETGINHGTIRSRVKRGLTPKEIFAPVINPRYHDTVYSPHH